MAADDLQLVSVKCELWGGCVWINLDDDAPPLRDWMEPFASIYDAWKVESLRVEWWQSCRLPVNWKLATAAFMEGYHVPQTHPQLLPSAQNGSPSEAVHPVVASSLYFMRTLGDGMGGMTHENDIRIAEGMQTMTAAVGSGGGDGGLAQCAQRRSGEVAPGPGQRDARPERPDPPRDHRRDRLRLPAPLHPAHLQQRLLVPDPSARSGGNSVRDLVADPDARRPLHGQADTPEPMAPDDPRWPPIPAQDFSNLPRQQKGLHSKGFDYMRLSDQIEGLISNFERVIDGFLAGLPYDALVPAIQKTNTTIDVPIADLGFTSEAK